jgi:hypothetical protein
MAGESAERQETGVIDAIHRSFRTNGNKPITVVGANGKTIKNVVEAKKHSGRTVSGSEPYTDVIISTTSKKYNVSNKGESAPSLAGGGLSGIETILPGLVKKFLVEGVKQYTKKKYKTGDSVPELFGLIDLHILYGGSIRLHPLLLVQTSKQSSIFFTHLICFSFIIMLLSVLRYNVLLFSIIIYYMLCYSFI